MSIYDTLEQLSIQLPPNTKPSGHYNMVTEFGGKYLYTAGTGCAKDGRPLAAGPLGGEVSVEEGKQAARQCVLNILANVENHLGDLNRISRVIKTTVFIASTEDFKEQSTVAEKATEIFSALFGQEGQGVRSAIGVSSLPNGQSVEIEVIFELKDQGGAAHAD